MKVYLAGKITGDKNYKDKFARAEKALKRVGFDVVISPAVLPKGMVNRDYMRICFAMIDVADVVAFIPDWTDSRGANLENAYCQYTGKQTFYLTEDHMNPSSVKCSHDKGIRTNANIILSNVDDVECLAELIWNDCWNEIFSIPEFDSKQELLDWLRKPREGE